MSRKLVLFLLALLAMSGILGQTGRVLSQGGSVWTEASYKDFADGTFSDAGANMYVSAGGRVETINRWDLNGDGFLDLVFNNSHAHSERLDPIIYWGNGNDFDISRSSYITANGAHFLIPADLNGDGHTDLLVPSYHNGTTEKLDSFIYFSGGKDAKPRGDGWFHYPFTERTSLPSVGALYAAAGDLNRDGYVDVVIANSSGFWEYRSNPWMSTANPSRIYWGSATGLSRDRYTDLPTLGANAVALADLNKDGWPDVVLASHEIENNPDVDSHIYWGGPECFSEKRRTSLPTHGANMVKSADLNKDGYPDLVFANGAGNVSSIYYGSAKGFDKNHRVELETSEARDCAIADVNKDGYPDILFSNHQVAGNPTTESYLYYGSAKGFSNQNRTEFDTVGAWGVALGDLNEDGWIDVVISNFQDYAFFDVPSYVYWNSPKGFDPLRRTALFTHGAAGVSIADFNEDGHPDLVFGNGATGYRGAFHPVSIYWGNATGNYTAEHRQLLPGVDAYASKMADLNDDGYPDLLVANTGENGRRKTDSFIYWGGPKGYSIWRMSGLPSYSGMGFGIADLDRDGYLDVVIGNDFTRGDDDVGSFIYWGSAQGYSSKNRTAIPSDGGDEPLVADLNNDGNLDIVIGNTKETRGTVIYWGDGTRNYGISRRNWVPGSKDTWAPNAADVNHDGYLDLLLANQGFLEGQPITNSYIYLGNSKGEFTLDHRLEIPTVGACRMAAADFNKDGWLDIAVPAYSTGTSRATMSRVFWGGADGYSEKRMTLLPTNSGAGALAADFNRDGWMDLMIVNHRKEGNPDIIGDFGSHVTDSLIYWGGPDGFSPDRKLKIPTEGAHNDQGIDLGNIYDRKFEFSYVSSAFNCGAQTPRQIEWKGEAPFGSRLKFQVRVAETKEGLRNASWMGPDGVNTFYEYTGSVVRDIKGSWIQYRATFESPDGVNYPILEGVTIHFED